MTFPDYTAAQPETQTQPETHKESSNRLNSRLNWLRAGVLGANDGIVSVSALILGVIATGVGHGAILAAGIAATVAGAISMALGEFVSVSAQRDSERMVMERERLELLHTPEEERHEIAKILSDYGMSEETALRAATEIGHNDPFPAHLRIEYGIDAQDLTSPWHAALSSAAAFTLGAILPLLMVVIAPQGNSTVGIIAVSSITIIALAVTGYLSAAIAGTSRMRSVLRLVIGGTLGLALTYVAGALFGGIV
ncbi:VIT family protein [Corynebacterium ulcerans]|uniref:VIT1/CCC1 transporter family protein n=1 Tax=Corynebacterium ulcerans TaxID=65058 RepID=UPI00051F79B5|nr:VIT family protein [Corynebacterium ulcerans]AIT88080.1 Fe/Mn transporter [Corynebacterium ulcerans]ALD93844.1 Fe/Mn transporter [Corynebacterium ulcerans]SQG56927.1 VIT family [Corynebacterium ulcerans]